MAEDAQLSPFVPEVTWRSGMSAMKRDDVWRWIEADVENRAWYAASFVPPQLVC